MAVSVRSNVTVNEQAEPRVGIPLLFRIQRANGAGGFGSGEADVRMFGLNGFGVGGFSLASHGGAEQNRDSDDEANGRKVRIYARPHPGPLLGERAGVRASVCHACLIPCYFSHNNGCVMAMLRFTSMSVGYGSLRHSSRYFGSAKAIPAKSRHGCRAGQPSHACTSGLRGHFDLSARYG